MQQKKTNRALLIVTEPGFQNQPVRRAYQVKDIVLMTEVTATTNNMGYALAEGVKTSLMIKDFNYPVYVFEDIDTLTKRANRDDEP